MTDITKDLEDVWRNVCQVFGFNESSIRYNEIQQKLVQFNQNHLADSDYIDDVIQALSRGHYLTKSAVQWQDPAAGHNLALEPNATHKARGVQWRLVMAYGGFETFTKALIGAQERGGLTPKLLDDFTKKCDLPNYSPLIPPNSARAKLEKWLKKPSREEKSALACFLSIERGDKEIIEKWIIQATPISTWADAARLAKGLRNASAHGALSATKVNQWGLQNALLTLADNLGEIVVAGMRKLT